MQNIISYFGGKNRIVNKILSYFPSVSDYDIYLECFGGSAAALINKEKSKMEIYNDLEKNVYSLYKCISDSELSILLKEKCKKAIYHEDIRKDYKNLLMVDGIDILDRAFYFWYVSRTSRNGNVSSSFKVDSEIHYNQCRSTYEFNNSPDLIDIFFERLKSVVFHNRNALELLEKYRKNPKAFIYLDPPYHIETRTKEAYLVEFSIEQHKKMIDLLIDKDTKAKILLSGYYHSDYEILENKGYVRDSFNTYLRYGKKTEANILVENIWRNYELNQLSLFSA